MAKKGKDLFEMLQLRARGGQPVRKPAAREPMEVLGGVTERLKQMMGGPAGKQRKTAAKSKPQATKSGRAAVPGAGFSGPKLAAVAFACLGVGFLLGRMTAGSAPGEDLRVTKRSEPRQFPPLPGTGSPDLPAQEEIRTLSKFFFQVLHYADSEKERASRLAHHLRQHGVETARIKRWPLTNGGHCWAVFAYVVQPTPAQASRHAQGVLDALKAVPSPDFEERLQAKVAQLAVASLRKPQV